MKLLERVDLVCRRRGMSGRTAQVYGQWIRQFLAFSAAALGRWVPPERLGTAEVESFLNHLVGERHLSASSQNQALNALVFLYKHVLSSGGSLPRHFGRGRAHCTRGEPLLIYSHPTVLARRPCGAEAT